MTHKEHLIVTYALHLVENGGKRDPKTRGWSALSAEDRRTITLLVRHEIIRSR